MEKKEDGERGPEKLDQNDQAFSTAEKIAEETGVSAPTVRRNAKFAKAVDKLPVSAEEYQLLEESILKEGCRDPLVVWPQLPNKETSTTDCDCLHPQWRRERYLDIEEELQGDEWKCQKCGNWDFDANYILLDGHNRYEICRKHQIGFKTLEKEFDTEDEAKIWIIRNQLGRRNLTREQISYLIGLRYNLEKKEDGERGPEKLGQNVPVKRTSEKKVWRLEKNLHPIEIPDQGGSYIPKLACSKCLNEIIPKPGLQNEPQAGEKKCKG